ncbi:hypothetical protein DACRYDRAFT_23938 [Dacryopinax primogenitus]|uniref:Protein transport protein SEC31 n=1 Tax=Dacryopinax primogenitus (strain DJM 731) TaxID=1858805 RepID=M5FV06_DACPD|nr:uncharacterized protein DACRYDRAFT_23938 [Dacryopinax primogenitus]EJT99394.1 hypothetical protein DACRYDRAFT_23938 [Dacryopinax primogenitus]
MRLKTIPRTSTFAWSPVSVLPLLATGTVAGALDENFSNEGRLELWEPDLHTAQHDKPTGSVVTTSRFNRLAWGNVSIDHPKGLIAAGMESGELGIWDPEKIVQGLDPAESLILSNKKHQTSLRGLDFNGLQTNLLASGASAGEIYIWDLTNPTKPYTPTGTAAPSTKLDLITSLAWNSSVAHVLASSSSTGYTVVWDLRGKREVVALAYGGGAATGGGAVAGGMEIGRRRGMSDVCWHPENPTRLVTSSEDDTSPIIMLWDLRNSRAPEKILTGHEKGVLSVSWCKQDADLLLSCGKDNRSLCWNPQVGEIIGELPSSHNWAFQVDWCPRNPDFLATASFDGTIGLHSLQSTNEAAAAPLAAPVQADGADIFDLPSTTEQPKTALSLKQPPKWLRRPTSSSFGFGGKLASVHNSTQAVQHGHGKGVVKLRTIVTESSILERLEKLIQAEAEGPAALQSFVEARTGESAPDGDLKETWRALSSLFRVDNRDELITLLGFSKEEVKERVKEAVEKLKIVPSVALSTDREASEALSEPTVTFAEPEHEQIEESEGPQDTDPEDTTEAPSETSVGATSIGTKATAAQTEADTETTEPSLFGEDIGAVAPGAAGTPAPADPADFFSSMGTIRSALPERVLYPHQNYANDSSQAATIGSRSSSIADLNDPPSRAANTFKIYPSEESDVDKLVTKALVLGDFDSAVQLCLGAERFADAILLAVKGGPELLASTQKAYFQKRVTELPYLRLFQSIVSDDLADIVQNADLREWKEIFVVLCTFAKADDFSGLAEQLGQRLEFQGRLLGEDEKGKKALRKDATLCYLAAGKLEKVVGIWTEEMKEEEDAAAQSEEGAKLSTYDAHASALQTFIEKVAVFRGAASYVDTELTQPTESAAVAESGARTYKLAALYDRYYEYADLIASQGLVKESVTYVAMIPSDYRGVPGMEVQFDVIRDRLLQAAGVKDNAALRAKQQASRAAVAAADVGYFPKGLSAAPVQPAPAIPAIPAQPAATSAYAPYGYAPNGASAGPVAANPYAPAATGYQPSGGPMPPPKSQPYPPSAPMQYPSNNYANAPYGQPAYQPSAPSSIVPPPPPVIDEATGIPPPDITPGPPRGSFIKREATPGWNDAPTVASARRAASAAAPASVPPPITAPFPNSPVSAGLTSPYAQPMHQTASLPPPPSRGSTLPPGQPGGLPPPQRGQALPPPRNTASPRLPGPPPRGGPPGPPPGVAGRPFQPPPPGRGPGAPGYPPQRTSSPLAQGTPGAPPMRALSPPQQGPPRMPPPGQPRMQGPPPGRPANGAMPGPPGQRVAAPPGAPGQQWPSVPAGAPPVQGGPYGPPPGAHPPAPPSQAMSPPSGQPPQLSRSGTPAGGPPMPAAAQAPKYPPGDRSHIPSALDPIFQVLSQDLAQLKATIPPQQKRLVDDTERRLNNLFDALNCESLTSPVVQQLHQLIAAMQARDFHSAMNVHVRLLTSGTASDNVAIWGPGIKQILNRMGR